MNKLTAIKIKYDDGTYSDEIPISVLSENVEWDSTHTLVDVLGSIDVDAKGTIQAQIDKLSNEKANKNYVDSMGNSINSGLGSEITKIENRLGNVETGKLDQSTFSAVLGNVDVQNKGTIQSQINKLSNEKVSNTQLTNVLGVVDPSSKGTIQAQIDKLSNEKVSNTQLNDVLGNVDVSAKGTVQDQINNLSNIKADRSDLQGFFNDKPVTALQFISTHGGKWEQYILNSAYGTVCWTKIGTFTMNTGAEKATIRLFFGNGFNGQATQHGIAVIHIQKAWQSAASTTNAFGISYQLSGWQFGNVKVQGRCTESNKLDLYFYTPAEYNSQMQVEITGGYDAFDLADTISTSAPTDGVEQDCRIERILAESHYYMSADGNYYEPIFINGDSTYIGTGTYKVETTDDVIEPSQSYKLSLGASDRPWGRGYIGGLELFDSESNGSVYIDFHFNNSSADYTDRIIETAAGTLRFQKSDGYSTLTAAAFSQVSSRHVKHNIEDMGDPTDLLMQLRPVSFYYNSDAEDQHLQYGLIAEEAEKILPSIVDIPDGYKDEDRDYDFNEPVPGIDYSKLVPLLLKEVQLLERRVEELEKNAEK